MAGRPHGRPVHGDRGGTPGNADGPRRRAGVRVQPDQRLVAWIRDPDTGAAEGDRRWVLRDLERDSYLRFGDETARLLEQLDGTRSLDELLEAAERQLGPAGPDRLARLLADLGDHGLLEGVEAAPPARGRLRPREWVVPGAGSLVERMYRRGGWTLTTRPALIALSLLAVVGVGVFAYLVAHRYGTPFVVASKLGLGGLVFLLGRFAFVAAHELAHGLAMASFGRPVDRAGLKLLLVFPYAFVDTSQAWFEPRRRRIAISAAGPASDVVFGALCSLACLLQPAGAARDVWFQLAFAAYVGALFNLNPFLDRDGYHILVDVLREPGLRRRAREQLMRGGESRALARYGVLALGWSVVAALFVIALSFRYRPAFEDVAPEWIVWAVMAGVWAAVCVPVAVTLTATLASARRLRPRRP